MIMRTKKYIYNLLWPLLVLGACQNHEQLFPLPEETHARFIEMSAERELNDIILQAEVVVVCPDNQYYDFGFEVSSNENMSNATRVKADESVATDGGVRYVSHFSLSKSKWKSDMLFCRAYFSRSFNEDPVLTSCKSIDAIVSVESISLSSTSIVIEKGKTEVLTATVKPSNAKVKQIIWGSSNDAVVKVSGGKIEAISVGRAIVTATAEGHTASCSVLVKSYSGAENGHNWVDLGLSVKWATCNVGATTPNQGGNYYAWGETSTKTDYEVDSYKYYYENPSTHYSKITKYCPSNKDEYWKGSRPDNIVRLELSDDAANVNWGGGWRTPTKDEWAELISKCSYVWSTYNGMQGYFITGPNGKNIFIPAAGYIFIEGVSSYGTYANYWSSSLYLDYPYDAYEVSFSASSPIRVGYSNRCDGYTVRPVLDF